MSFSNGNMSGTALSRQTNDGSSNINRRPSSPVGRRGTSPLRETRDQSPRTPLQGNRSWACETCKRPRNRSGGAEFYNSVENRELNSPSTQSLQQKPRGLTEERLSFLSKPTKRHLQFTKERYGYVLNHKVINHLNSLMDIDKDSQNRKRESSNKQLDSSTTNVASATSVRSSSAKKPTSPPPSARRTRKPQSASNPMPDLIRRVIIIILKLVTFFDVRSFIKHDSRLRRMADVILERLTKQMDSTDILKYRYGREHLFVFVANKFVNWIESVLCKVESSGFDKELGRVVRLNSLERLCKQSRDKDQPGRQSTKVATQQWAYEVGDVFFSNLMKLIDNCPKLKLSNRMENMASYMANKLSLMFSEYITTADDLQMESVEQIITCVSVKIAYWLEGIAIEAERRVVTLDGIHIKQFKIDLSVKGLEGSIIQNQVFYGNKNNEDSEKVEFMLELIKKLEQSPLQQIFEGFIKDEPEVLLDGSEILRKISTKIKYDSKGRMIKDFTDMKLGQNNQQEATKADTGRGPKDDKIEKERRSANKGSDTEEKSKVVSNKLAEKKHSRPVQDDTSSRNSKLVNENQSLEEKLKKMQEKIEKLEKLSAAAEKVFDEHEEKVTQKKIVYVVNRKKPGKYHSPARKAKDAADDKTVGKTDIPSKVPSSSSNNSKKESAQENKKNLDNTAVTLATDASVKPAKDAVPCPSRKEKQVKPKKDTAPKSKLDPQLSKNPASSEGKQRESTNHQGVKRVRDEKNRTKGNKGNQGKVEFTSARNNTVIIENKLVKKNEEPDKCVQNASNDTEEKRKELSTPVQPADSVDEEVQTEDEPLSRTKNKEPLVDDERERKDNRYHWDYIRSWLEESSREKSPKEERIESDRVSLVSKGDCTDIVASNKEIEASKEDNDLLTAFSSMKEWASWMESTVEAAHLWAAWIGASVGVAKEDLKSGQKENWERWRKQTLLAAKLWSEWKQKTCFAAAKQLYKTSSLDLRLSKEKSLAIVSSEKILQQSASVYKKDITEKESCIVVPSVLNYEDYDEVSTGEIEDSYCKATQATGDVTEDHSDGCNVASATEEDKVRKISSQSSCAIDNVAIEHENETHEKDVYSMTSTISATGVEETNEKRKDCEGPTSLESMALTSYIHSPVSARRRWPMPLEQQPPLVVAPEKPVASNVDIEATALRMLAQENERSAPKRSPMHLGTSNAPRKSSGRDEPATSSLPQSEHPVSPETRLSTISELAMSLQPDTRVRLQVQEPPPGLLASASGDNDWTTRRESSSSSDDSQNGSSSHLLMSTSSGIGSTPPVISPDDSIPELANVAPFPFIPRVRRLDSNENVSEDSNSNLAVSRARDDSQNGRKPIERQILSKCMKEEQKANSKQTSEDRRGATGNKFPQRIEDDNRPESSSYSKDLAYKNTRPLVVEKFTGAQAITDPVCCIQDENELPVVLEESGESMGSENETTGSPLDTGANNENYDPFMQLCSSNVQPRTSDKKLASLSSFPNSLAEFQRCSLEDLLQQVDKVLSSTSKDSKDFFSLSSPSPSDSCLYPPDTQEDQVDDPNPSHLDNSSPVDRNDKDQGRQFDFSCYTALCNTISPFIAPKNRDPCITVREDRVVGLPPKQPSGNKISRSPTLRTTSDPTFLRVSSGTAERPEGAGPGNQDSKDQQSSLLSVPSRRSVASRKSYSLLVDEVSPKRVNFEETEVLRKGSKGFITFTEVTPHDDRVFTNVDGVPVDNDKSEFRQEVQATRKKGASNTWKVRQKDATQRTAEKRALEIRTVQKFSNGPLLYEEESDSDRGFVFGAAFGALIALIIISLLHRFHLSLLPKY